MKRVSGVSSCLLCVVLSVVSVQNVYAELTLNSSISVTETYTDNLFFDTKKNKQDDFGTFVIPRLTLTYLSRDVVLSGTYSGVAQFYVNHSGSDAYTHNANFGIDLPFLTKRYKGLEVRIVESMNFSPAVQGFSFGGDQSDQDNPLIAAQRHGEGGFSGNRGIAGLSNAVGNNGVFTRRTRSGSFRNRAGVRVRYHLTPRWIPNASYMNLYTRYTDSDLNDSLSHILGTGVGYLLSSRTRLNANYTARISDINNGDTVVTHSVTGGVGHTLTPTVYINARAGVSFTESVDRVTFTSNVNVTKSFDAGVISARYFQGVTPGGGLATSGVLTQRGQISGSYPLAERVTGFLAGGIAKNKSLSGNQVDVKSYQGQAGFSILLLEWLSGNISYSYIKQKSNGSSVAGRTATVNQGFIGFTARLPAWRIAQ
ncbi:MAG: hypothetical protein MRJ96_10655 [Nitrospirales bacterium]|nr:hypothetical protein [Nitrospira sp.]MDR4501898.1 hypothetical protein [Nitrospirales bacterium]